MERFLRNKVTDNINTSHTTIKKFPGLAAGWIQNGYAILNTMHFLTATPFMKGDMPSTFDSDV